MGNRNQRVIGIVEGDMAALADGEQAVADLEGLLLRLGQRPVMSSEDCMRLGAGLQRIRVGFGVVRKYLRWAREAE